MYIHKYKPCSLHTITYNKELNNNISKLSRCGYINNMLFHGIEGSGKKTFVMSYLAGIYGNDVHNIKTNSVLNGDVKYRNSNYHIEIDLGQHSSKNKRILINFIKLYSSTLNISTNQPKIVVLYNADNIPTAIQLALRRILELYHETARYIFVCKFKNKIIEPIISRLFCLRVRGITRDEGMSILKTVCCHEKIETTDDILNDIIKRNTKYNYKISIRDIVNDLNLSYIVTSDSTFKYEKHVDEFGGDLDKIIISLKKDKLTDHFYQRIKDYIDKHMLCETSYTDIIKYILYKLLGDDYPDKVKFELIDLISTSKIYMCNKPTLYLEYIMFSIVKIIR